MDDRRRAQVEDLLAASMGPAGAIVTTEQTDLLLSVVENEQPRQELMPAGSKTLAYPMYVIPPERLARLENRTMMLLEAEVTDEASYRALSDTLKAQELEVAAQKRYVTELRRPFGEIQDRISKESTTGLEMPERSIIEAKGKVREYLERQERLRLEQQRKAAAAQAEADRKRREAEAEKARQEAALRAEVERKRQEAERLRFEAEEKERLAAEVLSKQRTTETLRAGVAGLEEAQEVENKAAAANLEAKDLERRLAELQAAPVVEVVAPVVEVVAPVKTKGAASIKQVPKLDSVDLKALPLDYHMADEKKILKVLAQGVTIPGVKYHMEAEVKSARGTAK